MENSERECKSAMMQMSYVFRGNTDRLYTNPHNNRHFFFYRCNLNPCFFLPTLHSKHSQDTISCESKEDIDFKHRRRSEYSRLLANTNTPWRKKNTYLSAIASAGENWFIKTSLCFLHTAGNGWRGQRQVLMLEHGSGRKTTKFRQSYEQKAYMSETCCHQDCSCTKTKVFYTVPF